MANAVTHASAVRVAFAQITSHVTPTYDAGTATQLRIYDGTMPANAATALSGNNLLATITSLVYGTPNATTGAMTVSGTAESSATAGTATFYRRTKSDGTCIEQGTVGTSGTDMTISSTTIASGANVSLSSGTYTPAP